MDIYYYILKNIIPIITEYQLNNNNDDILISLLHLSNYEELLINNIEYYFIKIINKLISIIKPISEIYNPLNNILQKYNVTLEDLEHTRNNNLEIIKNIESYGNELIEREKSKLFNNNESPILENDEQNVIKKKMMK